MRPRQTGLGLWATAVVMALVAGGALAAEDDYEGRAGWGVGMGLSYPLVGSFSAGLLVPLAEPQRDSFALPGVPALRANLDLGLGGGMASAGISLPTAIGYGGSAVTLKGALLRSWLLDVGIARERNYSGPLVEVQLPDGKAGVGYLSDRDDRKGDAFLYLYFGVGI